MTDQFVDSSESDDNSAMLINQHHLLVHAALLQAIDHVDKRSFGLSAGSSIRSQYNYREYDIDMAEGEAYTIWLRRGHDQNIPNLFRLSKDMFEDLVDWFLQHVKKCGRSNNRRSAAQKVFIFLYIVCQGASFRTVCDRFQCSSSTVSHIFHEVLDAMLVLHKEIVKSPSNEIPARIGEDPKMQPFKDCVGALDGTHVPIAVPTQHPNPWRNRKGWISQNVLGVVDFDMNFLYVLPGWEGSAHDSRVFDYAVTNGFAPPLGKYYLGDAGYSYRHIYLLTPYQKVRYHLNEHYKASQKPQNKEEIYNFRHSQLRNVVERTFGVLKRRFRILDKARLGFDIDTQVDIIFAVTTLHNFINRYHNPFEEAEDNPETDERGEQSTEQNGPQNLILGKREAVERRDKIAQALMSQYAGYLANRVERSGR